MDYYDTQKSHTGAELEFWEVLRTRRSVRSYSDREVDDATLMRVLEAGRIAPSATNKQPWHFVVVRNPQLRRRLAELAAGQMFVAEAPVVIAVCGQSYPDRYSWIADHMFLVDASIAIDHMTLAARAQGLGTCWVGAFSHDPVHQLLKVPQSHRVVMLLPLGYPSGDAFKEPGNRKPLTDIVSYESYGSKK